MILDRQKYQLRLLQIAFFLVFFSGGLSIIGVPDFLVRLLIELLIVLGFLNIVQVKRSQSFYSLSLKYFFYYTAIIFISMLYFSSSIYITYLYYRYYMSPFLILLITINFPEHWDELSIVKTITSLHLIQIVASFIKVFLVGQREEYIGVISVSAGTISTVLPMVAIAFSTAFFFCYQRKMKYIFIGVGFLFMGWAGEKRGIWFYTPFVILFTYWTYYQFIEGKKVSLRLIFRLVFFGVLLSGLTLFIGGKYVKSLNPDKKVGGEFSMDHVVTYVDEYNNAERDGVSFGRVSNTLTMVNYIFHDKTDHIILGYGIDAIKGFSRGDGRLERFGMFGPITGLTYHLIQVGVVGSIFLLLFYIKIGLFLFATLRDENDSIWQAIHLGTAISFFVFLIDFFTYSRAFVNSPSISFVFFTLSGLIYRRSLYREVVEINE